MEQFGARQSAMPPEMSTPIPADGPRAVVLMDVGLVSSTIRGERGAVRAPGLNDSFSGSLSSQTTELLEKTITESLPSSRNCNFTSTVWRDGVSFAEYSDKVSTCCVRSQSRLASLQGMRRSLQGRGFRRQAMLRVNDEAPYLTAGSSQGRFTSNEWVATAGPFCDRIPGTSPVMR